MALEEMKLSVNGAAPTHVLPYDCWEDNRTVLERAVTDSRGAPLCFLLEQMFIHITLFN
jgi:hypothetical protein